MSTQINVNSNSANSICIPRAFANISEARVRKVFDALNIFTIDRVDMIQRKNEKGEPYQRIFVHIREWSKTADAAKARERLLAGKELKIVYDDPWFWKASLNTWAPKPAAASVETTSLYDRKPRIRLEFEDEDVKNAQANAQASASFLSEDQRPYRERRLDPVYCEQDVKQGFRDRRLPNENVKKEQRKSRFSSEKVDVVVKKENPIMVSEKPLSIAPGLPEIVVATNPIPPKAVATNPTPPKAVVTKALVKDPYLVIKMQTMFRKEITDDIYLNNRQMVRDFMRESEQIAAEESEIIDYGDAIPAPKKRERKIIVE